MNIVICDDDCNYGEVLSEKIKICLGDMFKFNYKIIYTSSLAELKHFLENDKADILFLDIMVNGTNSVDWAIDNLNGNNFQFDIYDLLSCGSLQYFRDAVFVFPYQIQGNA